MVDVGEQLTLLGLGPEATVEEIDERVQDLVSVTHPGRIPEDEPKRAHTAFIMTARIHRAGFVARAAAAGRRAPANTAAQMDIHKYEKGLELQRRDEEAQILYLLAHYLLMPPHVLAEYTQRFAHDPRVMELEFRDRRADSF